MKVAIVHDWLTGMRGGERCLESFLDIYPEADIFTLLHVPGSTSERIDSRVKQVSFLQKLPLCRKYYRILLPFYPAAVRQLDFTGYNLIISLSHAAAKNITPPRAIPHVSYCFSPMRYIWDQAYKYFGRITPLLWPAIKWLRSWDVAGSRRVDEFVAISNFISARIRCYYQRSSDVIYPSVETSWITPREEGEPGEAFLYAGALVPYKRPDLIVKCFNELGLPLWIVGAGPEEQKLKAMAGKNVKFFGRVSDAELARYYRKCRALIFPGKEDFGIIPVECMAAGRPVIAAYDGGAAETVKGLKSFSDDQREPNPTGVFISPYEKNELKALKEAVEEFIRKEQLIKAEDCVAQARKFSPEVFRADWKYFLRRKGLAIFVPEEGAIK